MTLEVLIGELSRLGVRVRADGSQLAVDAPKGALTAELRRSLQQHKDQLLKKLEQQVSSSGHTLPDITHDSRETDKPYALSDLQSAFYIGQFDFMDYHVRPHYYTELEWSGLDVARYEDAWHLALSRHLGSLAVVTSNAQLMPLAEIPPLRFRVADLRGESVDTAQRHLLATRERMKRAVLPLDRWPWLDWEITLYGDDQARIHFNANSFFCDGPGTQTLLSWVKRFYDNPALEAPAMDITFRDCVLALERLAQSDLGQAARDYWMARLPGLPSPVPLPRVADANPRSRSHLQRRKLVIDSGTWSGFKRNARKIGLTPSNAVAALYVELLGVWSNSRHFIINNMVTRRFPMHPQIFEVLGNFASLYPLEVDLREGATFAARAQRLQQQLLRDLDQLSWGGMQVLQALNRVRNAEAGRAACPFVIGSGLFMAALDPDQYGCLETPQALLDHQYWELPDGRYFAVWDLIEESFPPGLIDSMWRTYAEQIRRLSLDPDAFSAKTLISTPADMLARRTDLNTTASQPSFRLLHSALLRQAELRPQHPALITNSEVLSYQAVYRRTNCVARLLRERGARPGSLVAVLTSKGVSQVISVLSVLASGAAYVPVDPNLPGERIRFLLANARVSLAITDRATIAHIDWPPGIERLCVDDDGCVGVSDAPLDDLQTPEDLAYVLYTSGSTGEPKGVMISHGSAVNTIDSINRCFGMDSEDRIFGISAFSFDLSVYDIFGAIMAGATLVLPDAEAIHAPLRWLEQLRREKVTVWNSVPALMQLLVEAVPAGQLLPDLRCVLLSGDWIPVTLPQRIRQVAPAANVISLGGATEASIWSIYFPIEAVDQKWSSIPYGRPLSGQTIQVLSEDWQPCPDWVAGELYIGGDGLAMGYWHDEARTRESFVMHPQSGERLYRTGDFGRYLPSGDIEFLGRRDTQTKIQGYRVELGEIEASLLNYEGIAEAAVVVRESDTDQGRSLVAYAVPTTTAAKHTSCSQLQSHLTERLPSHMVPPVVILLDRLPLTANGKVDRKALLTVAATTSQPATSKSREFVAPRDEIEEAVARIWGQVLNMSPIGIHDDFFELGGQSFAAVRILAKLDEIFSRMLPLAVILEGRTIASLAENLRNGKNASRRPWSSLVEIHNDGEGTPQFFVHPAGGNVLCYRELARRLKRPVYGLQAAGLDGTLPPCDDVVAMAASYLSAVRKAQPTGPYHLGGWSSGGMVAFEMARQLESQGQHVQPLILIDCPAPLQNAAVDDARLVLWFLEDLNEGFPVERFSISELEAIPREQQLDYLIAQAGGLKSGLTARALAPVLAVFKAIIRAGRAYLPQPINANLVVLKARDLVVSEFIDHPGRDEPTWGWTKLTNGTVRTAVVAGTHYTLLTPPHLDSVVQAINCVFEPRSQGPRQSDVLAN